jgi:hypothetical protein
MSRMRRPQLRCRLQWLSRAARRNWSLSRRPHLNLSRVWRRLLRKVSRDHERRADVAAAEVVAEVVRDREWLRQHPMSPQNIPRLEHPR